MSKAKTMKGTSRTTKPTKPKAAGKLTPDEAKTIDREIAIAAVCRTVGWFNFDLDEYLAGKRGPIPDDVAAAVRRLTENAKAELMNLSMMFATE